MAFNILNTLTRFPYAILAMLLLLTEVAIAIWVTQPFIRGFIGDVLVIILLYTVIRSLFNRRHRYLEEAILIFAICIEVTQYFEISELLNIESSFIKVIIGQVFDWFDILAYLVGYGICKLIRNL